MSGVNRIVRTVNKTSIFPDASALLNASNSWNQGDLLIYDATAKTIRKPTTEAECITFLGISEETIVAGKLAIPYTTDVDASRAASAVPGPVSGVVAKLQLKSGDSLTAGSQVYGDPVTGAFNVQAAGTKPIGVYQGAAVTAGASTFVEVLLFHRYPNDTEV